MPEALTHCARLALPLAGLVLAGCEVASPVADALARQEAKQVINGVVDDRFPGVNTAPVTDCIIDNASASEILSVASASVTGVTDRTVNTVLDVAQRPQSVRCIANQGLTLLAL